MFKNLKPYIQPTLQNTDSFTVSSRFLHVWSWKQQMFHISPWKKVSIIRTVGDSSALNQLTVEALIPTWWHFLNEDAVVEHFSQPRTVSAIKRSELTQRQSFLTSDVYFMTGEFKVAEGRLPFLLSSCCSTFKVCCSMYDTLRHTGAILWRPDCTQWTEVFLSLEISSSLRFTEMEIQLKPSMTNYDSWSYTISSYLHCGWLTGIVCPQFHSDRDLHL